MNTEKQQWDYQVDWLVVGSGAGALTAAVVGAQKGLKTLVIEKEPYYGGSSATSGGGVWVPASDSAISQGQQDSPEEAFEYIQELSEGLVDERKIRAFTERARQMVRHIESISELRFNAIPYTDYHAELPGGKFGYRSHEPNTIHASRLTHEEFETLRPGHPSTTLFGYIPWTNMEAAPMVTRGPGWIKIMARVLWRYYSDIPQRLRSKRSRFLVFGNAIAAYLKLALNGCGGELWLRSPMKHLIKDESGEIVGAVVEREGKLVRVRSYRGVVLGAGGFERNQRLRNELLPGETSTDWSAGQEGNTGDAISAGVDVGAALDLKDQAWWAPTVKVSSEDRARPLFYERALPGCIIINQSGQRYMNEAASYHIAGRAMIDADKPRARSIPSWIVFDGTFRKKYPMGPLMPVFPDWTHSRQVLDMVKRSPTINGLAEQIDIAPEVLKNTISRFNGFAASGKDEDFGRGDAAYDRYYGDLNVKPNPNLAPIDTAPFYAMPLYPGDIGTKGGLATDEKARVLDQSGHPIPHLYAVGNCAASVMGPSYPGAGATLGPAMTFGYLAVLHATEN